MALFWLRWEVRHRWRSLLFLLALTAVCAGVVLTLAAGARRGATAVQRLGSVTLPADVQVVPYGIPVDWAKVRALPEVVAAGTFADSMTYRVDGVEEPFVAGNPPADGELMGTVERPVVLAGRQYDPTRPDEAVVTAQWVQKHGSGVGDRLTAHFYAVSQLARLQGENPASIQPKGPTAQVRIVGVVRSPWFNDGNGYPGALMASPALVQQHRANVMLDGAHQGALIRLRRGAADIPRFQADLATVTGRRDITVRALAEFDVKARHTTDFEAAWLAGIAVAAGLASAWTVGQVLRRQVGGTVAGLRALVALGMTGRQLVGVAAVGPALVGTAGVLLGAVAAAFASRWFPIGAAADFEPYPGILVDPLVLVGGAAAAGLLVVLGCLLYGRLTYRELADERAPSHRSAIATAAARAGLPVPAVVGARFALESGPVRSRVPSRSALVGAVVGTAGVLAALTLAAGVRDAATTAARFGQNWDLWIILDLDGKAARPAADTMQVAARDPDVTGLNDLTVGIGRIDGRLPATVFSYRPGDPPLRPVMLSGRVPTGPGEAVLGPGTARDLGIGVGGRFRVSGDTGESLPATVTGIGFVPNWSDSSYDRGAWLSGPAFDRLFDRYDARAAQVALRPGTDPAVAAARLTTALGRLGTPGQGGAAVQPTDPLTELEQIGRVRALPSLLGGFLALLALAAAAHALFTATRRRGYELAVLRAVGMTPRQTREVSLVQGVVLAVVGLALGMPLGVALGRTVWRAVAGFYPLQYVPPLPAGALMLATPSALALVLLLATLPARRSARTRVADILRAE